MYISQIQRQLKMNTVTKLTSCLNFFLKTVLKTPEKGSVGIYGIFTFLTSRKMCDQLIYNQDYLIGALKKNIYAELGWMIKYQPALGILGLRSLQQSKSLGKWPLLFEEQGLLTDWSLETEQ